MHLLYHSQKWNHNASGANDQGYLSGFFRSTLCITDAMLKAELCDNDSSKQTCPAPCCQHHDCHRPDTQWFLQWSHYGEVSLNADVHQGVDSGEDTHRVEEGVAATQKSVVFRKPVTTNQGDDGEWGHKEAHQDVCHGQVHQKEAASVAHIWVTRNNHQK